MADTIQVRGEGGGVFTLDLPLHEAIEEQLTKGTLVRIDADGNPVAVEPDPTPEPDQEPESPAEPVAEVDPEPDPTPEP